VAFNPLAQIPTGVASTTQLNASIVALNQILAGLSGQTQQAASTSTLTVTNVETDVPGATLTLTVTGANAFAIVNGTFDYKTTTGVASQFFLGLLSVDGGDQTANATHDAAVSGVGGGCTQTWKVPLSAGSHTLKLRAIVSSGAVVAIVGVGHTTITATVWDIP